MKKNLLICMAVFYLLTVTLFLACKKDQNFDPQVANAGPSGQAVDPCGCKLDNGQYKDTVMLPTVISASRTLTCDTLWRAFGGVYVITPSSNPTTTLTIAPGARIEFIRTEGDSTSCLVITRASRLSASGTQHCPIVFTAAPPVLGTPGPGHWGGIVLLGRAPLNRADTTIEGISEQSLPAGVSIHYGGGGACLGNAADNSGVIRYVRIEYAGAANSEGKRLNGLTCGGVGTGTVLQFIQVAYSGDDGFEFFGGTVNARNLVAYGNNDDDLDFDFGWIGKIQFVVASKVPSPAGGYSSTANGIESDNTPTGSCSTCKTTLDSTLGSVVANVTIIGNPNCANPTGLDFGAFFKNGSNSHLKNSILIDYPTAVNITSTCPVIRTRCNYLQGYSIAAIPGTLAAFNDTLTACPMGGGNNWPKMVNPYAAVPVFTLQAGSPAASGACPVPGITATSYRGAFNLASVAGSDWTANWSKWNF